MTKDKDEFGQTCWIFKNRGPLLEAEARLSQLRKELPLLDALLCGKTLWNIEDTLQLRKKHLRELHVTLKGEHDYLIKHEPPDEFHACVVLGALNLVEGLLAANDV